MKGQTGWETLSAVSILIVILIITFAISVSKTSEVRFIDTYLEAQRTCGEIKNIINHISSNGFGSAIIYDIPNKIKSSDYNLTVNSGKKFVTLEWESNLFSCSILTSNVTNGTLSKGVKTFRNSEGVVTIG